MGNEPRYKLFAQPYRITTDTGVLAQTICPVLAEQLPATQSATFDCSAVLTKLNQKEQKWNYLAYNLTQAQKDQLAGITDPGVGFEEYSVRSYPEASLSAQLLGFVGKTDAGEDVGYFGIEGLLENELKGKQDVKTVLTDALGYQLSGEGFRTPQQLQGRDVVLTIRRDVQFLAEQMLKEGIEKYGAKSGEIIILDPANGDILALANMPTFDPATYYEYDPELYKNHSLTDVYEPGSTFKVLTVAAGINEGVIAPDTQCPRCAGPRVYGKYTIKTWNEEYHPNISMTQALEKSDNIAMIFVSDLLGADRLRSYLQAFGIGQPIGIELQGDAPTPFPAKWGPVELATISFGQGIGTTSLQLIRAVATIANKGVLVHPTIVKSIIDPVTGDSAMPKQPAVQVITPETARTVSTMMESSAAHGEAKWVYAKNFRVAGKTGTSQIANEGGYAEKGTIASFIGFSPPENPKFVMLVKLVEPQSSPWAAETAAPLWFKLASRLYLLFGMPYDDTTSVLPQLDQG